MDYYTKLWVYEKECIFTSAGSLAPFEKTLGNITRNVNIWDYANELFEEGWEVFQIVNPQSEKNIELYLKKRLTK